MIGLKFTKPTLLRLIFSVVFSVIICSIITGVCLFGYVLKLGNNTIPSSNYVQLFFLDIVLWGPFYLIVVWPVSVPIILLVAGLLATLRRNYGKNLEQNH